jgi:adenylate cyclase
VNLTSRLEGLNKFYGTEILLSAVCAEAAGDAIITRPVDNVSVKGRSEGILVHELLAMAGDADDEIRRLAQHTNEAFTAYLRGDFQEARERYQTLLVFRPNDAVAALMSKRCGEFVSTPPPTNWDTTFRMKDK